MITVPDGFDIALLISDLMGLSLPFVLGCFVSAVFLLAVATIKKMRP